ncbi:AmmeMemoRadiSam system protein B [Fodinibius sediminis]|uniref:AmmeMemoRadiSam system protein B n=1 Tax=Fodinibius sediminis TaxID=1214077 RepID=A0A521AKS9_9BACT|nr:AmmeMemoRadiSam system protein B [Fodinibius sediminis]SMO35408.1 AmmeMemoRadiSam system protein B [Fodinibius sediminis]
MSDGQFFNSKTEPIPPLRPDLQIIPVKENGRTYLYFHDQQGYATPEFALYREAAQLLSLFDGQKSITDLGDNGVDKQKLLEFVQLLDKNRLLTSEHFKNHAETVESEYEASQTHSSVTSGASYPADPQKLIDFLDAGFEKHAANEVPMDRQAKALYAPHIDPRVALGSYAKAFAPIRNLKPKRVVLLATSHYAGLYPDIYQDNPFILVDKDFELPLGTVRRDRQAIRELAAADSDLGISLHDRAHRKEHSIELHLLFLSYLWDHPFQIIPFVIRGLDDLFYKQDGHLAAQLDKFATTLRDSYGRDEETFFLISGDLAHFGKKFGDDSPASTMFEEVETFDQQFLTHSSQNDRSALLKLMTEELDPYRICGFPPLYTFLKAMPDLSGNIVSYDLWDERDRDSAVTFGSILYQ